MVYFFWVISLGFPLIIELCDYTTWFDVFGRSFFNFDRFYLQNSTDIFISIGDSEIFPYTSFWKSLYQFVVCTSGTFVTHLSRQVTLDKKVNRVATKTHKRPRGRPQTYWTDDIKRHAGDDCMTKAKNRNKWILMKTYIRWWMKRLMMMMMTGWFRTFL